MRPATPASHLAPGPLAVSFSLCRAKTRLLLNALLAWRGTLTLIVFGLLCAGWCLLIALAAQDALAFVQKLPLGGLATSLIGLVLLYLIFLVFTSDLILGHTLNAGQMSTDFGFLTTLPISPGVLLTVKLYERMVTDWAGILLLLSSFLGLASHQGLTAIGAGKALLLFWQIQVLMGLAITIGAIVLQRLARPSTVNNFFSLAGYLSAFFGLIPYLYVQNNPQQVLLSLVFGTADRFTGWWGTMTAPGKWLAEILLAPTFAGPEWWNWHLFWLASCAAGIVAFLVLAHWHWPTFVHPGIRARLTTRARWFTGMLRKEFLLLKSDFNLLTNALFMPFTIIVMEVYVLRGLFKITQLAHAWTMMAAAAIYFCLFGPLNAIGSEGQAISQLETLPMSPEQLLGKKNLFWMGLGTACFVPATIGVGLHLEFSPGAIAVLTLWTLISLLGFTWVAVSLSALFARFEGKVLQQRSTLSAKILGPLVMGLLLPAKDLSAGSFVQVTLFVLLAWALHVKAADALRTRLDDDARRPPRFAPADALIILLATLGLQQTIAAAGSALDSQIARTLWPYIFAYPLAMIVLAKASWDYARARFPRPAKALGLALPGTGWLIAGIGAIVPLVFAAKRYLGWLDGQGFEIFQATAGLWETAFEYLGLYQGIIVIGGVMCVLAPLIEEIFFRGFLGQALERFRGSGPAGWVLNGALFALIHPVLSMPMVFLLGVAAAWLFDRSKSLWPGILLHAGYNLGVLLIHHGTL
jgi:membrane protease YdiL (CAAX protease family)